MKGNPQSGSTSAPTKHASRAVAAKPSVSWDRELLAFQMPPRVFVAAESSETANSVRKGRGGGQRRKEKEVSLSLFWCHQSKG